MYILLDFQAAVWTNGGMHDVRRDITSLGSTGLPTLRSWYEEIESKSTPPSASAEVLRQHLAWHLQALQQGLQPHSLRQRLLKKSRIKSLHRRDQAQPGTRLIREWQGVTYEVTVLKEGYLWQGKPYRSLSQIATSITGTRWSGPRFFGIKTLEARL